MTWEAILDYARYVWILFAVPLIQWGNKKRKEYASLVKKVEKLQDDFKIVKDKIDEDRKERKEMANTVFKIYDTVKSLETKTAVNTTRLEERK